MSNKVIILKSKNLDLQIKALSDLDIEIRTTLSIIGSKSDGSNEDMSSLILNLKETFKKLKKFYELAGRDLDEDLLEISLNNLKAFSNQIKPLKLKLTGDLH